MAGASRKPLLVGQAPSRLTEGLPAFGGKSGRFLAGLLGLELPELLGRVEAVNLLGCWPGKCGKGDAWDAEEAGAAADRLSASGALRGRTVLLAGKKVAAAFGLGWMAFLERVRFRGGEAVLLPHPSGVSHWWNDAGDRMAVMVLLRGVLDGH